jgi:MoxR-like ATPase
VADVATVRAASRGAAAVHAAEPVRRYVVRVCEETRADERVELGASPRAGLMLFRAAKAHAALSERDHVLPDDVQTLAPAVLSHRLVLTPEAIAPEGARSVVADALDRVPAL